MPHANKQGRDRARLAKTSARSVPPVDEIKDVLRDQIQTLIDSYACPSGKDLDAIRAGRNWKPKFSQIESPAIRREIVCLERAIQLLAATEKCTRCGLQCVPRGTTHSPANSSTH